MRLGLGLGLGLGLVVVALIASCGEEAAAPPPGIKMPDASCREGGKTVDVEDEEAPEITCDRPGTNIVCAGDWAALCDGGRLIDRTNCRIEDDKCYERACDDPRDCARCLSCKPNAVRCGDDGARERCNEDGSAYEPDEPCDESAGLYCDALSGQCLDLCAQAEAERSYIGCEYYAVSTSNAQLELREVTEDGLCQPFSFAIVVANGESVPARVTIETPDGATVQRTIRPARTEAIPLPCSLELTGMGERRFDEEGTLVPRRSSVAVNGAHHITSNVPITVYQFNPLEFESGQGADRTNSFTNDASLLLPVSSLTTHYMASTVPTLLHVLEIPDLDEQPRLVGPGFVTIVGVSEQPTDVEIHSTAHTLPSEGDMLPALAPGDTAMLTLERGQVAQILSAAPDDCDGDAYDDFVDGRRRYCEVSRDYDLTGTRIEASQPVLVLAGHDCTFVPFDRWACDHVEEVMQPLESWGKDIIVALTAQPECRDPQPNVVRVLASHDGTRVELEPELHEPVTLDRGEVLEVEIKEDLRVIGSKAISVSQLLVGQQYDGRDTSSFTKGDPSLSLAIPSEQWRRRYSILTPETFTDNFVGIIARADQNVLLDGRVVTRLRPVEGTPYATAQLQIPSGQHTLESILPFGVTVYGYAPFTSYMVAGGLDLNLINPPQ